MMETTLVPLPHRRLNRVSVIVVHDVAVFIRLNETVSGTDVHLRDRVQLLLACDQFDRIAGHDVLHDEQNQRDAEEDRDEL